MKQFNRYKNVLATLVFLVSAFFYIQTLEPTVSWWDCGEFITSAYKLEVGHPPGAPFYILAARFFTLFAANPSEVAVWVNLFSALASAATVMLLFLTIVLLSKKFFRKQPEQNEQIIILGSALTGSLAFAFTDSFWNSAVESEVYALSLLFTASVFWAILKWENEEEGRNPNRWLILIAYLTGLSTGVHLLSLLALPAVALIWYFKKFSVSWQGIVLTFIVSIVVIGCVQIVIISGIPFLAFQSDRFFVNQLKAPVNTGMFVFILFTALFFYFFNCLYKSKTIRKTPYHSFDVTGFSDWVFNLYSYFNPGKCKSTHEPESAR